MPRFAKDQISVAVTQSCQRQWEKLQPAAVTVSIVQCKCLNLLTVKLYKVCFSHKIKLNANSQFNKSYSNSLIILYLCFDLFAVLYSGFQCWEATGSDRNHKKRDQKPVVVCCGVLFTAFTSPRCGSSSLIQLDVYLLLSLRSLSLLIFSHVLSLRLLFDLMKHNYNRKFVSLEFIIEFIIFEYVVIGE